MVVNSSFFFCLPRCTITKRQARDNGDQNTALVTS